MRKKLIAFGVALLLFAGSSMTALADGVCPGSNDGRHVFESRESGMGTMKEFYHQYLVGYIDGQPIYRNCKVTQSIAYCSYVCRKCGYERENSQHSRVLWERHSINHN